MTAYTFPRTQTFSPDVAARKAARKKVVERAQQLERESLQSVHAQKTPVARRPRSCYNRLSMTNEELVEQLGKVIDAKLDEN